QCVQADTASGRKPHGRKILPCASRPAAARLNLGVIRTTHMPSATIKIYLPHGDPKRLRTGEISNWSGKAVAGPRTELDQLLKREEAANVGVYLPTGVDPLSGG